MRFTDTKDGHEFWFHLKLFVPLPMMEVEVQDSAAPVHNHSVHGRVPLLAQVSSPTPECVVPVHQITLKSMVCHVGTFVSQEFIFINPTTAQLTLSIVFIDSPNFCVVEATRPSVPVAQLTIGALATVNLLLLFKPTCFLLSHMQLVISHSTAGRWQYVTSGMGTVPMDIAPADVKAQCSPRVTLLRSTKFCL